jgi:hypothetical protein
VDAALNLTHEARWLLARHVDSVGALDLLLLLHGGPAREWTVEELCDALDCPPAWASGELASLRSAGVVAEVAGARWRYLSRSPSAGAVDELARAARQDRATLTRAIFRPRASRAR